VRHRRSRTRHRSTATGAEPRAARSSADGCVSLSDALTSRRHLRRPARYTPGPSQVRARSITGHRGPARPGAFRSGSGPVTGHRGPRHPDAGAIRCPGRGGVANPPVSARYQRKFRPGARRSGWAARLPPDLATERGPRPGITGDLSGPGRPITGPDDCPSQESERFGEPLAPAWFCPPYVRNHCYAAAHSGTS
jgi:hypothetical protein